MDRLEINKLTELADLENQIINAKRLYIGNNLSNNKLLITINDVLKNYNKEVVLSLNKKTEINQQNFKQLQLLTNLKKLRIIVFNGLIEDLSDLSYIDDLEEFRIYDNVKKGISLEPLAKFKNLTTLGLYTGFTTKQYSIINTFDKLQCLDAFDIDLSKIVDLPIKKLFVGRKILGSELILKKIPSIESIFLEKCKEVNISSISQLERLNSVHLRYMNHISVIPFFKNEEYIYDFECVGLSKLENIEAVFRMKKLRALMLTNLELLKAEDFSRLSELPNLKIAYITFKDPKENLKFFEFCQRNNWIYKQPALVK
ncbi:hypothetical protein [Treponema pedis]